MVFAWRFVRSHKILTSIALSLLLIMLLLIAYRPTLSYNIAVERSGINANRPQYVLTGFKPNLPIDYDEGVVSIEYTSEQGRWYIITQFGSGWDSGSLQSNYVDKLEIPYDTFVKNGVVLYIFNNGSATWINSGIWVKLESDGILSPEAIFRIFESM